MITETIQLSSNIVSESVQMDSNIVSLSLELNEALGADNFATVFDGTFDNTFE